VGVGLSREVGRWRHCGFNASVLAQEGRRWDEALPEDKPDVVSSSWLHEKEV
jgi:hypothetical protein